MSLDNIFNLTTNVLEIKTEIVQEDLSQSKDDTTATKLKICRQSQGMDDFPSWNTVVLIKSFSR